MNRTPDIDPDSPSDIDHNANQSQGTGKFGDGAALRTDDDTPAPADPEGSMQFSLEGASKLTDWKKEPSLLALKQDMDSARMSHDLQVYRMKRWNELLFVGTRGAGADRNDPYGGDNGRSTNGTTSRSRVQPKLVRRQAEWRYSALSEPFLSSDKIFKINPVTFEDTAAARQNELVLNWQFRTKLDRVWLIDNIVRATVDEGTCICRLGWKRYTKMVQKEVPVYTHYPLDSLPPQQAQQIAQTIQQAAQLKQQNPRTYTEKIPPELQASVDYMAESGIPTVAHQSGTQMQDSEEIVENQPTIEVLNPENVFIDPSCQGQLDRALFVIVSFETNKAELLKDSDRYQNLDKVNWAGNTPITDPFHATTTPQTFEFRDIIRKKVVAYEYWGFCDINNDGILQPIVATWIGDTLIRMEMNPFPDEKLPFVVIPYLPIKRELYGEPDAEMLEDNQKILGAVTRGMIDLLANSANGQKGFAKGMLDPVNRRKFERGNDYEFNPQMPTTQGVIEHKYPELPQSALTMLSLQNQEAEALTGVKSFSGGLSGNAYGNVATGMKNMMDAASKREMSILRRVAKGIKQIGDKIIAMNGVFLDDQEVVRVTNEQFVTISREDLKGQFDLMVDISTFEVDNQKAQDLGFMLQTIGPSINDPAITTMILGEIADLKRMPALAERLRNYKPPPPNPMEVQMQQLEMQLKQAQIQALQTEAMLNQAKSQQAAATAGEKHLNMVEQETGTQHLREVDKIQAQGRANQHLAVTQSLLKPTKEGEKKPEVQQAVGYNALSAAMEAQQNR